MKTTLKVAAGAALGAVLRWSVILALGPGMLPLIAVNTVGSFLMGRLKPGPFLGTGVLGGFTSFSTFAVLLTEADPWLAAVYLTATLLSCVGGWLVGDYLSGASPGGLPTRKPGEVFQ
ncbi:fluoride efflux transporter family protein [Corynebacterium sp. P7202]|uniref:Fluoride-specific ion channel FluC n=1 Tax=Corynebacterium pygosceleis TaxID=2800406 RepID=A0A9Q4GKK3_9CORY|nr:fluoride efflux transporter family protein [Corynebacterium pygosceleis]MCK7638563.1 fluoride efflux transporter family protein [Corynebacterium pygosceleis]MCX7445751.1 fluoride efflux transporter family protein [Corynebacterium pygosceleis]MCX7469294.1 fluoride efflux transporter family protein [Corynebacterium pygosceleis]